MKMNLERIDNMKKRKNAFTLIELLAVIVILAIIALIAVPTVMNIINKAQKSAFKDSAYGIIKAGELYYTNELLEPAGMTGDVTFTFPNDTVGLEIKGSKPTGGSMIVNKDGKTAMAITDGKYCVKKGFEEDDVTISDDVTNCKNPGEPEPIMTSTNSCIQKGNTCTNEEIKAGVLVNVKVSDTKNYDFYVVSNTGNEVTLIMDRNLGEKVAWYKDTDDTTKNEKNNLGPITALNYLNTQTSDWNNIPVITNYTYDNNLNGTTNTYGYQKLEIVDGVGKLTSQDGATVTEITGESKTRLLTEEEVTSSVIGCTTSNVSCPSWIYGNTSDSNTTASPFGYWILTANPSDSTLGRFVGFTGCMGNVGVYYATSRGVRPVITLSK